MALGRLRSHRAPDDLPVIIEKTSGLIVDPLLGAGQPALPVRPAARRAAGSAGPACRDIRRDGQRAYPAAAHPAGRDRRHRALDRRPRRRASACPAAARPIRRRHDQSCPGSSPRSAPSWTGPPLPSRPPPNAVPRESLGPLAKTTRAAEPRPVDRLNHTRPGVAQP